MEDAMIELLLPRNVIVGPGSLRKVLEIICQQNARKICFVADEIVYKNSCDIVDLEHQLRKQGIDIVSSIFVKSEPTFGFIRELLKNERVLDAEVYIAIGGGSVIDTAKILSACCTNPAFREDLYNSSLIKNPAAFLIAVPTTAGTGAEATPNAILLDEEKQLKVGIVSKLMVAQSVILDPNLTRSLPKHIAATTGIDALAHAIESFISKKSNSFCELYGLTAIRLIFENLEKACNCDDIKARENMLLASFYAGVCLVVSSTCAVHAMAYPLAGTYHVPHGVSISMLLYHVMEKIYLACAEKFSIIYRSCFGKNLGADEENAAAFLRELDMLLKNIGAVFKMSDYGVKETDLYKMAMSAIGIKRLFDNNPVELTVNDLVDIYKKAL